MALLRIAQVTPLQGHHVRLVLTDGSVVERDLESHLSGPAFEGVRSDPELFQAVTVEAGSLVWPNGADLCPDVVIWNGPPQEGVTPPAGDRVSA